MSGASGGGRGPRQSGERDALDALDVDGAPARAPRQLGGGLSPSMDPEVERAALKVSVPKAPLVPHDIARMPNRELPRWSGRPEPDDPDDEEDTSGSASRRHTDADLPPPIRFEPEEGFADAPQPGVPAEVPTVPTVPVGVPQGLARGRTMAWVAVAVLVVAVALFALLR